MSVTANHCHDQRVHPTSAQQSRAGPHFRQISHSASAAATPDDDLEPGHQKPHLLQPPYTTSAQSKAVQECSLQPLPCAGHDPRGAAHHLRATSPTLHSSCSSKAGAMSGYIFRCSCRATTACLLWATKFWSHIPQKEAPDFLVSFFLGHRWCFICLPAKTVEEEYLDISFALKSL